MKYEKYCDILDFLIKWIWNNVSQERCNSQTQFLHFHRKPEVTRVKCRGFIQNVTPDCAMLEAEKSSSD